MSWSDRHSFKSLEEQIAYWATDAAALEEAWLHWTPQDMLGYRIIRCELCLRWRHQTHFPTSVCASVNWHDLHRAIPRKRTKRTCRECRKQEVNDRMAIEAFRNFRVPDE